MQASHLQSTIPDIGIPPQYDDLIKQPIVLGEMPVSAIVVSLLFLPSCYSTLRQIRLLLMLSVTLLPHKASI